MDWNVQWDMRAILWKSWERCGIELLSRVLNDVQKFPVLEDTRDLRALLPVPALESSAHLTSKQLGTARLSAVAAFAAYASIVSYIHPAFFVPRKHKERPWHG